MKGIPRLLMGVDSFDAGGVSIVARTRNERAQTRNFIMIKQNEHAVYLVIINQNE